MSYKIGDIVIDNPIALAPMAGVCNVAFRTLVKRFGVGLIYAEMVSDKAVVYKNEKTMGMLAVDETEHPMAMQIFGSEIDSFVEAASYVNTHCKCDIIDINMGCPVPKITKNEAGAKLLLDADKIFTIVQNVVQNVDKPVTVKMRVGWDKDHIQVIENAKAVEAAGAKAVAIHGRTAKQMYTGKADWSHIKDAKAAVNIPVIGNGDVRTPEDAKMMIEQTGCDGVMVGRAALGNPWLMKQMVEYLEYGTYDSFVSNEEKLQVALAHLDSLIVLKGEKIATLEMRSHMAWYVKGMKGNVTFKKAVQAAKTPQEMQEIVKEYQKWLRELE